MLNINIKIQIVQNPYISDIPTVNQRFIGADPVGVGTGFFLVNDIGEWLGHSAHMH